LVGPSADHAGGRVGEVRRSCFPRLGCVRAPRDIFHRTLINTFIFTIGAQVIGLLLGKFAAMLLMRDFPGRGIARALVVLPWAVPVSLATLAWQWMFDSLYSVINWTLIALGLIDPGNAPQWLGQEDLAMLAVTVVHAWRLFPFGVVIFIAGFTSVPKDVLDAATVDGAGFWRRNYQIILPMIAPIVVIALIFGTVFTFTDLSVVYLLTKGADERHANARFARFSGRHHVRRRRPWRGDMPVPIPVPAAGGDRLPARAAAGDLACRGS
jgi:ABC-type sugar transport system permease subunit